MQIIQKMLEFAVVELFTANKSEYDALCKMYLYICIHVYAHIDICSNLNMYYVHTQKTARRCLNLRWWSCLRLSWARMICVYVYVHVYIYMFICFYILHGPWYLFTYILYIYIYIYIYMYRCMCSFMYILNTDPDMGWLRSVGSIKLQVSFAE